MSDKNKEQDNNNKEVDHNIYKRAKPEEADAECYVFTDKDNF